MGNSGSQTMSYEELIQQRGNFPVNCLPQQAQRCVFNCLLPKDLLSCRLVSKSWNFAANHHLENNIASLHQHQGPIGSRSYDEFVSFLKQKIPATWIGSYDDIKRFNKAMSPAAGNPFPFRTLVLAIDNASRSRRFRSSKGEFDEEQCDALMKSFVAKFGSEIYSCIVLFNSTFKFISFEAVFEMKNLVSLAIVADNGVEELSPGFEQVRPMEKLRDVQVFGNCGFNIFHTHLCHAGYGMLIKRFWVDAVDEINGLKIENRLNEKTSEGLYEFVHLSQLLPNLEALTWNGVSDGVIQMLRFEGDAMRPAFPPLKSLRVRFEVLREYVGHKLHFRVDPMIFNLFKALDARHSESLENLELRTLKMESTTECHGGRDLKFAVRVKYVNVKKLTVDLALTRSYAGFIRWLGRKLPNLETIVLICSEYWKGETSTKFRLWCRKYWADLPSVQWMTVEGKNIYERRPKQIQFNGE